MKNSNNDTIKDQDKNTHPQPTDDAGAEIETVTPDTEKEGAPNDAKPATSDIKGITPVEEQDEAVPNLETGKRDTGRKKEVDSENPEPDQHKAKTDGPDIETVSP